MRTIFGLAGTALVLIAAASAPLAPLASASQQTAPVTLSIIGTNDLHGGLVARDGRGGFDVFAGYVNNLRAARARDGGAVLLVDAGDMFQGTLESNLSEGASVVAAYNALGYAAAAIGNHEFDFGPVGPAAIPSSSTDDARGALKARAAEARFPFLAANLIDAATDRVVDWPNVRPSTVVRTAGVQVGIVGVMTKDALATTIAANTGGLRLAPLAETITHEAASLRANGASVVIVAAHAGAKCARFDEPEDLSSCDTATAEIADVIRRVPPGAIDVVVAGHTHAVIAHVIGGVRVMESYNAGRSFGRVDLTVDRATGRVAGARSFAPQDICARVDPAGDRCDAPEEPSRPWIEARYEGAPVVADRAIGAVLAPANESVRALKRTELGVTLDTPVRRPPLVGAESPLGNLFTDAMLASAPGADVAINNTTGGLRMDLAAGPLTYGALFEVFPFDNVLARFSLTGAELTSVLSNALQQPRAVPGIAGVRAHAECRDRTLVVSLTRADGRPIAPDERLSVLTTDFLATGGDRIFSPIIPAGGLVFEAGPPMRDVVADWLRRRGGHLNEAALVDRASPRWTFPGAQPVTCDRSVGAAGL